MPPTIAHDGTQESGLQHPIEPASQARLRVLHVVPQLGLGGTEIGVLKVIRGIGDQQFEHRICAVRGIDKGFQQTVGSAIPTYSTGTNGPGFQFPLFRLAKLISCYRPHIVHTRNFGALETVAAAKMNGVPIIIHSEHGYEIDNMHGLPARRRLVCRALYSMAHVVFTVTNDLRAYHARQAWMSEEKFQVIYNGVNTERFSPRPDLSKVVRRQYGIPWDRVVIGSVGRLVPIKNHSTLLRAVARLLSNGFDAHLVLVGDGPELPNLRRQTKELPQMADRVTFAGASENVAELLNAMDVFVLPSLCEGMSNTVLEAMACGVPAVISRAGGNGELLEEGRSGFFFNPKDEANLADIIASLIQNKTKRIQIGLAARQRILEEFDVRMMVDRYRNLYGRLAEQKGLGKQI